jgi:hypothetical protein
MQKRVEPAFFALRAESEHLLDFHQAFGFQTGFIARALRAIFAIFRAGAGLDRQQRADLHMARIEVLTVYLLRFKQQLKERFLNNSVTCDIVQRAW